MNLPMRSTPTRRFAAGAALVALLLFAPVAGAADAGKISYNRDIRPILSDNCFYCHGPDKAKRKGKFRLDELESAVAKEAIVPGKPADSTLVARIVTKDAEDLMPPAETHKKLTEAQKALLKRWIAEGAEYQPHWAYITPKRPPVPAVKQGGWGRNAIDPFVLQALEEKGLAPSRDADKRTLLRRLSLDLIGLPPTPSEVEGFVNDSSPNAYEKQVDRLLVSPRYGERMAVPWLDAVRFADTVGFHGDQNQNIFPYRDYVIDAFNKNKPFDQFTIEQLAGDLLANPTTEQLIATGFNRLNMVTREGGAQPKEYLAKYAADRVRTVGTAWLGSTFGCAECHDHKFDPIKTKDFYSLGAFWADVKQWGVYMDYGYTPNPDLKGWSNDHPFPPEITVDSPYLKSREGRLIKQVDAIAAAVNPDEAALAAWRKDIAGFLKDHPSGWATAEMVPATVSTTRPATVKPAADGSVLFTGKAGADDKVELALPAGTVAAVRLELLPDEKHNGSIVRGGTSATVQPSFALKPAKVGAKATNLAVFYAEADHKQERYSSGHAVLGIGGGWKTDPARAKSPQTAVYLLDSPAKAAAGDQLVVTMAKNTAGRVRVSVSPIAPVKPTDTTFGKSLWEALDAKDGEAVVRRAFVLSTPGHGDALTQIRAIQRQVWECRDGRTPTLVTQAWEPRGVSRILPRGNWQDESGEVVQPATPGFLPKNPDGSPDRKLTRLDLAKWIVSPDNPLTARTIVNRQWKQLFGNGLCNTVEDLGAQGEPPSHPELLDWLAVEFRESGWDVKHMVKLMVMSATYRQGSNLRPELKDADPANRLLASQNPRRLEAEFVRDNALFAAGLLNTDLGGPSAHPYQPDGYYANIQFPDRKYVAEADDRQYRRGLYMHWQRTFLHPMLANFDAPSREDTICTRVVSNTPQQALTLLNDPEFVEAARVLAARAIEAEKADGGRLAFVYQNALCRPPKAKERESLAKFLAVQRECYKADPEAAKKLLKVGFAPVPAGADEGELAAWATVCRVVLNLHETITRY